MPALATAAPRGEVQVPQRAIDLFSSADEEFNRKNYGQAATLAEGALGHTNPLEHRDQRGSLIQLLIAAYTKAFFKDGHVADLCRLEQILEQYAEEVSQTFEDPESRDRVLAAIAEHRSSNRVHLMGSPAYNPDVGCPGTKKTDLPTSVDPATRPVESDPETTPEPPEPVPEPLPESTRPTPESTEPATKPKPTRATAKDNPRRRGRLAVITGSTFLGMSGVMLAGSLTSLGLASRAYHKVVEFEAMTENGQNTLIDEDAARVYAAQEESYSRLAIGMGISAGVFLAVGLPVLAVGLHRRRKGQKNMAIQPVFSPTHAGLSLSGQF